MPCSGCAWTAAGCCCGGASGAGECAGMAASLATASLETLGLQDYLLPGPGAASRQAADAAVAVASSSQGFRLTEADFLQEQIREGDSVLEALEEERDLALLELERREARTQRLEGESEALRQRLVVLTEQCESAATERRALEGGAHETSEQIRVRARRRERQEKANRELEARLGELRRQHSSLEEFSERLEAIRATASEQLEGTAMAIEKRQVELDREELETQRLRNAQQDFLEAIGPDLQVAEAELKEAKQRNVGALLQIQHNEVREHRLGQDGRALERTLDELKAQKMALRRRLEAGDSVVHDREAMLHKKETLEKRVGALKRALQIVEESNESLQDERANGWSKMHDADNKVYALMDQLRQVTSQLCRQRQRAEQKRQKVGPLEAQVVLLQEHLGDELDARLAAEGLARSAAHETALVKCKHRALEESFQLALKSQRQSVLRLQELQEKVEALHVQHDFMKTRIDGNEDDRGSLRYEHRVLTDRIRDESDAYAQLVRRRREVEHCLADFNAEKESIRAELDYIRREDMLDEYGRTQPILIESTSRLVERLQINEFLYSAQMARNPVPLLVQKISHLLEMVQHAEVQAELFLQDIMRSQEMLEGLRQKNLALTERVELRSTWRMRALRRFVANSFEARDKVEGHSPSGRRRADGGSPRHALLLDGLRYRPGEPEELADIFRGYGKESDVREIALRDSGLDATALPALRSLLELCPYLRRLDLRRNCLAREAIDDLVSCSESIPGATSMEQGPASGSITVLSGNQVKLVVDLEGQCDPSMDRAQAETCAALWEQEDEEVAEAEGHLGQDADIFLASLSGDTWPQGLGTGPASPTAAAPCRSAELGRTTFVFESSGRHKPGVAETVLCAAASSAPLAEWAFGEAPTLELGGLACKPGSSSSMAFSAASTRLPSAATTLASTSASFVRPPLIGGALTSLLLPPAASPKRRWRWRPDDEEAGAAAKPWLPADMPEAPWLLGDSASPLKSPASTASTQSLVSPMSGSYCGSSSGASIGDQFSERPPSSPLSLLLPSPLSRSGSAPGIGIRPEGLGRGTSAGGLRRSSDMQRTTFVFQSGTAGLTIGGQGGRAKATSASQVALPRLNSSGGLCAANFQGPASLQSEQPGWGSHRAFCSSTLDGFALTDRESAMAPRVAAGEVQLACDRLASDRPASVEGSSGGRVEPGRVGSRGSAAAADRDIDVDGDRGSVCDRDPVGLRPPGRRPRRRPASSSAALLGVGAAAGEAGWLLPALVAPDVDIEL
mmetsp:Transcript_113401/g.366843  ORF Transcript_113401/g.366843 Transcript_113401/m.366843 type:complete len:1261 (-) Transcript_113401:48-3830(-)